MKRYFTLLLFTLAAFASCRKDGFDPVKQAEIDEADIKYYIGLNDVPAVKDSSSGIYYYIVEPGGGARPEEDSKISMAYKIELLDGTEINEGTRQDQPLAGLIPGLRIGIPKIREGGQIILFIPSGQAYGPQGYANIPPNQVLIYSLSLTAVTN